VVKMKNVTLRITATLVGFLIAFGIIYVLESIIDEASSGVHAFGLFFGILIGGFVHEILLKRFMSKANQNV